MKKFEGGVHGYRPLARRRDDQGSATFLPGSTANAIVDTVCLLTEARRDDDWHMSRVVPMEITMSRRD